MSVETVELSSESSQVSLRRPTDGTSAAPRSPARYEPRTVTQQVLWVL